MTEEEYEEYGNLVFRTHEVGGVWSTSVWTKQDRKEKRLGTSHGAGNLPDSLFRALVDAFGVPPCVLARSEMKERAIL